MANERTPAQIAVEEFERAQAELHEFLEANDEFIDELRRLTEEFNITVKNAQIAIKSQLQNSDSDRLVIGAFGAVKKRKEYWDGTQLAAILPRQVADLVLKEIVAYEVNVSKLEQVIRQGEVDRDETYEAFHQENPTVAMMPGAPKERGMV